MARRVCIIGGSFGGILAAEACSEHGLDYTIYERHDFLDGSWLSPPSGGGDGSSGSSSSGRTSAETADISEPDVADNVPKQQTPGRGQLIQQAARVGCLNKTRFKHRVVKVSKSLVLDHLWDVEVEDLGLPAADQGRCSTETCHSVLDCTGRFGIPLISFPLGDVELNQKLVASYRALARASGRPDTVLDVGCPAGEIPLDLRTISREQHTSIDMGTVSAAERQPVSESCDRSALLADWSRYINDLGRLVDKTLVGAGGSPTGTSQSVRGSVRQSSGQQATDMLNKCSSALGRYTRLMDVVGESKAASEIKSYLKCELDTVDWHEESEVAAFYAGKSVFITGATGFVGKCLLEKLLRSCPDIGSVYVLVRPKRGLEVGERLNALLDSELFARLRDLDYGPKQLDKVQALKGDITKPLFGLSSSNVNLLTSKVAVVINCAACINLTSPMKHLIEANVVSVGNLVELAAKLSKLEALVHLSSAYSNADKHQIDEVVCSPPMTPDKLLALASGMDSERLEAITPGLLGGRPNKYALTKAVGESLLLEKSIRLMPRVPIAIVRPSIVASTWRQPIRGWVDNYNGSTGALVAFATGALHGLYVDPKCKAEIVPVDLVANLVICAACQVNRQHSAQQERADLRVKPLGNLKQYGNISVFNCVSGKLNPLTYAEFLKYYRKTILNFPPDNPTFLPGLKLIFKPWDFYVYNLVIHTIVGHVTDLISLSLGRPAKLVEQYKRMYTLNMSIKPFTTRDWSFECSNMSTLFEWLSPVDKDLFNFDVRQIRWSDYIPRYYIGAKSFVMKDEPKNAHKTRAKFYRKLWAIQIFQVVLLLATPAFIGFYLFL